MEPFCSVREAIQATKTGKLIIITDDQNRENEGDFFMAAQFATPKNINFIITHGKGLVCAPLTKNTAERLSLPLMVKKKENQEFTKCNFTIPVDAKIKTTSGISAYDRSRTLRLLANKKSRPDDFVKPGHIFPLMGEYGGLNKRQGHTEAALTLLKLARLSLVGVICEIINCDGKMANRQDLLHIAKKFKMKILTIKELKKICVKKEVYIV